MNLPEFDEAGNLPAEIFEISLLEAIQIFGKANPQRIAVSQRLDRIYKIAFSTGHLKHFIIFGSFVTNKPEPNDIDIFMIMDDGFDVTSVDDSAIPVFDHNSAQTFLGASIFWIREMAALGTVETAIRDWMITREGTERGIIEIKS